jgi:hypothetical protein
MQRQLSASQPDTPAEDAERHDDTYYFRYFILPFSVSFAIELFSLIDFRQLPAAFADIFIAFAAVDAAITYAAILLLAYISSFIDFSPMPLLRHFL